MPCSAGVPSASFPTIWPGDSPVGETTPKLAAEDVCQRLQDGNKVLFHYQPNPVVRQAG